MYYSAKDGYDIYAYLGNEKIAAIENLEIVTTTEIMPLYIEGTKDTGEFKKGKTFYDGNLIFHDFKKSFLMYYIKDTDQYFPKFNILVTGYNEAGDEIIVEINTIRLINSIHDCKVNEIDTSTNFTFIAESNTRKVNGIIE